MFDPRFISKHERIQAEILTVCDKLGIEAIKERGGTGWRADVYIPNHGKPIAFEVQTSPQTLKKTEERQAKFQRDGITGCWLFENPVHKLNDERPDLPLFYVEEQNDLSQVVNLGNRRKVSLSSFIEDFILNHIQFKKIAIAKTEQTVKLVFYEMPCWKCGIVNHLYYVDSPFYSACNCAIRPEEAMWASNKIEYRPEIIDLAQKFIASNNSLDLKLGTIKERYSHTVGHSYLSFGCHNCDSIFGDWFVMEAQIDVWYEQDNLTYNGEIELSDAIEMSISHWCYPEDQQFCS